jgi:hypothetical protein
VTDTAATPSRRPPLAAMAIAWLFPGMGHVYLGRRKIGFSFALIVTLTFLAGLSLQGRLYTVEAGQPLTMLATFAVFGAGLLNIVARLLSENPGGTILAATYEYGCAFLLTAGLMNLLLVLDVFDIATGRKQ